MELKNMSVTYASAMIVYLVTLLYSLNVIFSTVSYWSSDISFWLIVIITFLPALIQAIYFLTRKNFGAEHRTLLHTLFYIFTAIDIIFVVVFILPNS